MAALPLTFSSISHVSTDLDDDDDDDDLADAPLSPIKITISAPLHITGHHNIMMTTPSVSATRIAMAITQALRASSMSEAGLPMIDEEGRPRPVEVTVEAGIRVEGSGNVVGERMMRRKEEHSMDPAGAKRRAGSEPARECKRVRTEL